MAIRYLCVLTLLSPLLLIGSTHSRAAVPVAFEFQDSPGEGFFDSTPLSDPDVPAASTLGEAGRAVMQAAGAHLGSFFEPQFSGETWRIAATFNPLGDSIASAAPTEWRFGDTFNGGTVGVNFPAVLVNHRSGSELISGNVTDAEFDSNTDLVSCWHYQQSTSITMAISMAMTFLSSSALIRR